MAFFTITEGDRQGEKIDVGKNELSVGRAPDNDVVLDDPSVSSRHCMLFRRGGKYTLRDLGSTNGTSVNEFNIRETRLKPGDEVSVGNVLLTFDGDDVEVDELSPEEAASVARPATVKTTRANTPPAFGARKGKNKAWKVIMTIFVILAVLMIAYFVKVLFFGEEKPAGVPGTPPPTAPAPISESP